MRLFKVSINENESSLLLDQRLSFVYFVRTHKVFRQCSIYGKFEVFGTI
jgi:hypothetical protein